MPRINFYKIGGWLEDRGDDLQRLGWKVQDFSFKRRKPYTGPYYTLADLAASTKNRYAQECIDVMLETNEILEDLPWVERHTTGLPIPEWKKLYRGGEE